MRKFFVLNTFVLLSILFSIAMPQKNLVETFKNPDKTFYPWIYWYWLNGNINEDGLIADLEAMDEAGIGTAMAFDVGIGVPGKVVVRSDEWYRLMKKVILKADELGMRIGFNCPGWANAGGPWITPETAMKELTWTELCVDERTKNIQLPQAPDRLHFYKDIAVLAFPSLQGDNFNLTNKNCQITDTLGNVIADYDKLFDNNRDSWIKLPGFFEVVLDEPQEIRSMQVRASNIADSRFFVADMWYYDELSKEYKYMVNIPSSPSGLNDRPGMGTASFSPVKAKKFRFGFMIGYGNKSKYSNEVYLQELNIHGSYRIPCWHNKTGFGHNSFEDYSVKATKSDVVNPNSIINITDKMDANGNISWNVPDGNWTIVRLGYIPTGAMTQPLNKGLNALECDKYSKKASKVQFDGVMQPLFDLVGKDVANRVFSNYHIDSYEVGWQNWSECLPEEFKARRGYDMNKYLLTLTGRAVSSIEETNAFLWDFRRTMADCYADNHIGYISELARQNGMMFSIEAYDGPFEDLQTAGRTDMPMSEIWQKSNPDSRPRSAAMFAAHIYDRKLVGTEQFTGMGLWDLHPWVMKNNIDASFAYGVNNVAMHVFSQQPWTDKRFTPGATLGPWGAHYDRGNTWFSLSHPWHQYIARCQVLLREGQPVADYLQFLGDNAPGGGANIPLNPPFGYEGDALNGEMLLKLTVNKGLITLPCGKTYRYLVLPDHGMMNLSSLKKIQQLVYDGAIILGSRPKGTYSLNDLYKQDEFKRIVSDIFDEKHEGKVYENKTIQEVFIAENLKADFACPDSKGMNLKFTHRKDKNKEIYFVSNVSMTKSATVDCSFRTEGLVPEIWDPMTGERNIVLSYNSGNGITTIPIHFEIGETKFVVFSDSKEASDINKLSFEGRNLLIEQAIQSSVFSVNADVTNGKVSMLTDKEGKYEAKYNNGKSKIVKVKNLRPDINLDTPWNVTFEKRLLSPVPGSAKISSDKLFATVQFNQLIDWSKSTEDGIKYYSGTASYENKFHIKGLSKDEKCILKLGQVDVIAHVYVNDKEVGIYWKPPFNIDITKHVKKGENKIVIEVTNLWVNRLIGDEQFPDDVTKKGDWMSGELFEYPDWVKNQTKRPDKRRVSFTTYKHWKSDAELLPSGLNGPVTISFPREITF